MESSKCDLSSYELFLNVPQPILLVHAIVFSSAMFGTMILFTNQKRLHTFHNHAANCTLLHR